MVNSIITKIIATNILVRLIFPPPGAMTACTSHCRYLSCSPNNHFFTNAYTEHNHSELRRQPAASNKNDNWHTRLKASNLPTADYILRAVSLLPDLDTEERLKTFIIKHVLDSLRVTEIEKEQLNLSS